MIAPLRPQPAPLERDELERLWRWQRWMIGICAAGLTFMVAAVALGQEWGRGLMLVTFVGLIVAGILAPLREKCPRCGKRLSHMWRLTLPERCRGCGVEFSLPQRPIP